jgi:heterodisulfide reductase subunit A-like polyferredoxin
MLWVIGLLGSLPEKGDSLTPPSILNLDCRQGTDLPHRKHDFVDSHFVYFPCETRRTGIYAAGPVRRPTYMKQAIEDTVGAALKAIQSMENAVKRAAALPRVGHLSYPRFRKEGCTERKRCTLGCPLVPSTRTGSTTQTRRSCPPVPPAGCPPAKPGT